MAVVYRTTWQQVRSRHVDEGWPMAYERHSGWYEVRVAKDGLVLAVELFDPGTPVVGAPPTNDADWQDFVQNFRPAIDAAPQPLPEHVAIAGVGRLGRKLQIHESSRPDDETKTYTTTWAGSGDDVQNHVLGGGPLLQIDMTATDTEKTVEARFDPMFGEVWLHEGYAMWETAPWGCTIDCGIWMPASPVQTVANLDYELDGDRLRPASGGPGTGTHGLAGVPNPVPNRYRTGWFDYDPQTGLVPNPGGTGGYDIFVVDRPVSVFVRNVPLFGTSYTYFMLQSADSARIVPPAYFRLTARSPGGQAWRVSFFLTLYREITIGPP